MVCQHTNPVGYLFCSTCGQPLAHQRCSCGFVCAGDALYCGRCGHSLALNEADSFVTNTAERRYDLDLLVKLAGVDKDKRVKDKSHDTKGNE